MTKPPRILPPAELSPRVVLRSAPHVGDRMSQRRSEIRAATIGWRDLVLATWQLDDDHKFEGVIPDGMTIQRFSAKVAQAAGRLGGRVGVACRGRRWWTWTIQRSRTNAKETGRSVVQFSDPAGE